MGMTVTVYLDELILLNGMVSFLLLTVIRKLIHSASGLLRLSAVAFLSGIFSAICFFLPQSIFLSLLTKSTVSAAVVWLSFGYGSVRTFLKRWTVFLAVSLACAGAVFVLERQIGSDALGVINLTPYIRLSPFVLLAVAVLFCGGVWVVDRLFSRRISRELVTVDLSRAGVTVSVTALCDTGSRVRDPYTGRPVILCRDHAVRRLFSNAELHTAAPGVRLLPIETVSGSRTLRAYPADRMTVHDGRAAYGISAPLLALCEEWREGDFQAILPYEILSEFREEDHDVDSFRGTQEKNRPMAAKNLRGTGRLLHQRSGNSAASAVERGGGSLSCDHRSESVPGGTHRP